MLQLEPYGPIGIIAHNANRDFVRAVSDVLYQKRKKRLDNNANPYVHTPGYCRSDYIIDSELIRFQTGEGKYQIEESIRGHDIFIITDVLSHNETLDIFGYKHVLSPDDHYRDLLRIVSTCSGKARRINVIMPFVYEGRQEKRETSNESMDVAAMLKQLYELGVANLIIFDPHDGRIANAVPLMGIDFPKSAYKIISTLLSTFDTFKLDKDKTIVVSPDESGVNRGIFYSSLLNLPLGIFYRDRDYSRKIDGEHPIKNYEYLGDDISGRDVLIIDDMINSGSTMLRTSKILKVHGARDIYCCATFGLFTDGLDTFDEAYEDGVIKSVLCTNLSYHTPDLLERKWYVNVDMIPYVARIIEAINANESVTDLINSTSRITDFLGQMRIGELFDEDEFEDNKNS
ncbi:MAG: ribose-phosphate diphosphokinase [Clostridiales bacterium]|nr:ribose-phosphate diphosphokinase [Clostridiales bacterium]MBP3810076.1 ribose-phosphate diphosphokinase [Clostridiales bacterium]MBR4495471.1 ribose-phosphate diphosphokinase [Clostridiales bacterium]